MSLSRRLAQAEKALAELAETRGAEDAQAAMERQRLEAAWQIMRPSMSEEHPRIVVAAYTGGLHLYGSPGGETGAGRLLKRCLAAMQGPDRWPYTDIPLDVWMAMPPVVANAYLTDYPRTLHECEECGHQAPFNLFDVCPLCGGRIGYCAYFNRRARERH